MDDYLTIGQELVLLYWYFFDIWKYNYFEYLLSIGAGAEEAYYKTKNQTR